MKPTPTLVDLVRSLDELDAAARGVLQDGWKAAEALRRAIERNLGTLACHYNTTAVGDQARLDLHRVCLEWLGAHVVAHDDPARVELRAATVELTRLVTGRLFDLRRQVTVQRH